MMLRDKSAVFTDLSIGTSKKFWDWSEEQVEKYS